MTREKPRVSAYHCKDKVTARMGGKRRRTPESRSKIAEADAGGDKSPTNLDVVTRRTKSSPHMSPPVRRLTGVSPRVCGRFTREG